MPVGARSNSVVHRYFADIRTRRRLTDEEERDLGQRASNGCEKAVNELVEANLGFVVSVAARYRNRGLPLEDLVGEGNLGLLEAARRFDPRRGARFITFAVWWIRKAILSALSAQPDVVRIPDSRRRKLARIREARVRCGEPGREESAPAPRRHSGRRPQKLDEVLLVPAPRAVRLSEPVGGHGQLTYGDRLSDTTRPDAEDALIRQQAIERVGQALRQLPLQEQQVLRHRFGIGVRPKVLREVGARLGISRERVRQIEVRGTDRLRRLLVRRPPGRPRPSERGRETGIV